MTDAQKTINILTGDIYSDELPTDASYRNQPEGSTNRLAYRNVDVDILDDVMNNPNIPGSEKEKALLASPSTITKSQAISLGYTASDFT